MCCKNPKYPGYISDICEELTGYHIQISAITWPDTYTIANVEQALRDAKGPQQHWGVSDTFGKYEG